MFMTNQQAVELTELGVDAFDLPGSFVAAQFSAIL
jgi:hypothetical protein